ncbi:protein INAPERTURATE POLLEN1 [Silene latifolia]|uniref:protein INAPERTURATE POLLEN1 n=1 Tax=Silene latifolia TaxID=37657 RepID=UPI003D778EF8
MIKSIVNRFKNTRQFKDFYKDWITTLKTTLLPHLTHTLFDIATPPDPLTLATHVNLILTHFTTYFAALDAATTNDGVDQLLYPSWRSDVEKPFLWLGEFHPYIFTNLLRSFLETDDSDENDNGFDPESLNRPCNAWRNLDGSLGHKIENIECGLRLMVPAIAKRAREAQAKVVRKMAVGVDVGEVVGDVLEELTCVFLDANRLRRSVVCDIVGVLNVNQAAFFLHGLAQFYVGFWDSKLADHFNKSLGQSSF